MHMLMNITDPQAVGNFVITELLLVSAERFCKKELIRSQNLRTL
jgi:hypothetical protein